MSVVAAAPRIVVTVLVVFSAPMVGLLAVQAEQVPTDVVTPLVSVVVPAGRVPTVTVNVLVVVELAGTVTACVQAVPAADPVAQEKPWPVPV